MNSLVVAALALCMLAPSAHCATNAVAWCYHEPSCSDATWPTIAVNFCSGTRQSPIDIVSAFADDDSDLTPFIFVNYSSPSSLKKIENTGKTVTVTLDSGIKVLGGDLSEAYDSLQFHLHWGNGTDIPGSEHTVDGKRYPMELHIVNSKCIYNGNTAFAVRDPKGLAALAFFIEEMPGGVSQEPASWRNLTSYLTNITNSGDSVSMTPGISLDDLLVGVDCTKYYRYHGSLTRPPCNEAVVWTVFKDTVKVSKDLIDLFSTTVRVSNSSSPFMINVYRNIQPAQEVMLLSLCDSVSMTPGISLDDLLVGVDHTKYYRYHGSLTTPPCNVAVVWTVFKDTVKVSKDPIDLFSTTVRVSNSSSPFMINVYRNIQPAQEVKTQPAICSIF